MNCVLIAFKGQICPEKLSAELAPFILGSFYGRMGPFSIHKSEHEVFFQYIPVLVVTMHILVASCIVRRWKTVNKS